jgi:hypothetical protein
MYSTYHGIESANMYFDDCITHKKSNLSLPSPKPTEIGQPLKLILAVRNDYYRSKNNIMHELIRL